MTDGEVKFWTWTLFVASVGVWRGLVIWRRSREPSPKQSWRVRLAGTPPRRAGLAVVGIGVILLCIGFASEVLCCQRWIDDYVSRLLSGYDREAFGVQSGRLGLFAVGFGISIMLLGDHAGRLIRWIRSGQ